jgi:hypothetical protein
MPKKINKDEFKEQKKVIVILEQERKLFGAEKLIFSMKPTRVLRDTSKMLEKKIFLRNSRQKEKA